MPGDSDRGALGEPRELMRQHWDVRPDNDDDGSLFALGQARIPYVSATLLGAARQLIETIAR